MQKLYTLALAAAVAASASAADLEIRQLSGVKMTEATPVQKTFTATSKAKTVKEAPLRAASRATSIEGDYTFTLGDYYFQGGQGEYNTGGTIVKYDESTIMIDSQDFDSEVLAEYNEGTQTITFTTFELGWYNFSDGNQYYVVFQPGEWVATSQTNGKLVAKDYSVTFDPTTGSIAFPSDHFFSWAVYSDENCTEDNFQGYSNIFDVISMIQGAYVEPEITLIGEATFVENLIYPTLMQGAQNTKASKHEIYTNGQGIYYLTTPFSILYEANNIDPANCPDLVIDATDPDNVLIPMTATGLGNGSNPFLVFSESWYVDATGDTQNWSPEFTIKKVTEGNKVTITFPYHSASVAFGNQVYWGSEYVSTLTFTESNGISGVEADTDAPVTYYNLQGVRVDEPTTGVVIRVQGNKATKMVVK